MSTQTNTNKVLKQIITCMFLILFLRILSNFNYLLYHSVVEIFAIVVAVLISILATKTYKFSKDNFLLLLGLAYIWIAVLDILHLLTFSGMGVFPQYTANTPTQFWIAGRYMEGMAFLLAPFFINRKLSRGLVFVSFGGFAIFSIVSIMWLDFFPDCFISGYGLTLFKTVSEYIICLFVLGGMIILYKERHKLNKTVFHYMLASMFLTIVSEMTFTLYVGVSDFYNFLGHIFKVFSYILIYRGVIKQGFEAPYDLIFKELNDTNLRLQEYNDNKNHFLGMAAHDLRNPLGLIMMYSKFVIEGTEGQINEKYEKYLHRIKSTSEYMLCLVEDLLDIAKIEAGKLILNLEYLDLIALLRQNLAVNQFLATEKEIEIVFNPEIKRLDMYLDRAKIEQVLNNLISNGIKYSHPGSKIQVDLQCEKEHIVIVVSDEGQGIAKEDLEKIFNPFDRASNKTTGGESSTGLGLTITRKIVEEHQGKIWVESELGKGSSFYVLLPIREQRQESEVLIAN